MKSSSRPESETTDYLNAVLTLYLGLPETPLRASPQDRQHVRQLQRRAVPLSVIESAFLLASLRRLVRPADLLPLSPIRSLTYFQPIIEELLAHPLPENYLDYLRLKLQQLARHKKLTTKVTPEDGRVRRVGMRHSKCSGIMSPEQRRRRISNPGKYLTAVTSFGGVADRFLSYQKPRLTPKAYQREEGIAKHLKEFFSQNLTDITSSEISDYVTARLVKVSKSSVRKELNTLKHLFRLACGEWRLLSRFANPCLDVTSPKVRDERRQHLTPDQFQRVLASSPEKMRPIFALLTATGMRRSELLNCRWNFVEGSRILLPTSKNEEPKEVHLNTFATRVLASIPQGNSDDLLFPDVTAECVSMAFRRVCKRLDIVDIRLHDLRHTFATWLRRRGTELDVIASQLGHRDLRMTKRYVRIAGDQVKEAVGGIDEILQPKPGCVSHPFVTASLHLGAEGFVNDSKFWRPRRDLNPCYRRERALRYLKTQYLQGSGRSAIPCK